MTNSLSDLLANKWDEPSEITTIKDYVRKKYNAKVGIKLSDKSIIVSAPNAALAGTLRMNIVDLQKKLQSDKRIVIRIGGNN